MQLHLTATATVATTTSTSESPFSCWKWHNIITGCHSATLRATPTVTATAASHLCLYHTLLANLYGTWSWNRHNQTTITWSPQSVTVKCKNISSDIRVSLFFFPVLLLPFASTPKCRKTPKCTLHSHSMCFHGRTSRGFVPAMGGWQFCLPGKQLKPTVVLWQNIYDSVCKVAFLVRFSVSPSRAAFSCTF